MTEALPRTAVMVCAVTVATLSGPPGALAAPPDEVGARPAEPTPANQPGQDDPNGMPVPGRVVRDDAIVVWARGVASTKGPDWLERGRVQANEAARRHAFEQLVEGTSARVPPWTDDRIRTTFGLPFEVETVAQQVHEPVHQVEVAIRMEVAVAAFAQLQERCATRTAGAVTFSTCIPDALLVVANNGQISDEALLPGDLVLGFADGERERLDASAIEGMGTQLVAALAGRKLRVDRDGKEVRVKLAEPMPVREPDIRALAPTCGPCCHGHCDDEMLPKRFR